MQARVGISPLAVRELIPSNLPKNQVMEHAIEDLGLHVLTMVLKALRTVEATETASVLVGPKE